MMRTLLKSKIHNATVTESQLEYVGSITIDETLMDKADLWEGEQVLVANKANGKRLITYVMKGKRDSGIICMNGAAAHLVKKGDQVIIMAFVLSDAIIKPHKILVDTNNKFVRYL